MSNDTLDEILDSILWVPGLGQEELYQSMRGNLKQAILKWHEAEVAEESRKARIEENESLLAVALHEINLPDHCDPHDKYVSACYACKKRRWYGEISKDWKRIIEERLAQLTPQSERQT